MKQKEPSQISKAESKVVVYELVELADKTLMVGNSIEVGTSEAIALIKDNKAKHPDACIGVVPDVLSGSGSGGGE